MVKGQEDKTMAHLNIKIDYDRSILSISNSILEYYKIPHRYKSLDVLDKLLAKNYQNVVLMIIDGMGTDIIEHNLPADSFLRKHVMTNISSVFPPTTAAATIAYHSGLPPIVSGWLGWMMYFPQYDKIIELFRNTEYYNGQSLNQPGPAETLIKYKSIYQQVIEKCQDVEHHHIFPSFEENGAKSFDELCTRIEQETASNNHKKIFSTYWTEPDHTMHECGVYSQEVKMILENINDRLEKMASALKNTIVIISADHGALDIEDVSLNEYRDICETFVRPPALESRFLTFFIQNGKEQLFQKKFNEHFKNDFVLYTKQEFLSSGILGEGCQNPLIDGCLGEFLAIAIGKKTLKYTTGEREPKKFRAEHAGYSPMEMTVPLIVLKS